ncbi:MAG: hypothetical protein IJ762_10770 [Bacteroidaceae bacterium]|nr:hypothetical protein [Bacteroidaceae bacterium]MBR1789647.1 hypothetical protein [Bacteroidaceae bacterium]
MREIRIYHSIGKNIALIAVCFVFVALGIFILLHGGHSFIAWGNILFFGGGGLFMLFLILRERISHKAYYIVTDESVLVDSGMKKWEVRFADVEEFYLLNVMLSKQIGIKYKAEVEFKKMNDASLPIDGLNIKPQELCDLLNMRLTK